MIRFIHTADIHFGMENYGRIDPKTGIHTRLLDFEKALNFCIDYAIEHTVDFFMFSGDAYKTAHPSPTQQRLLLQCFLRLFKANIPIVMVIGNHDNPLSFGKAHALDIYNQLPVGGFHVFSKPGTLRLETKNGPINIVGIPWPTRTTVALTTQHVASSALELTDHISSSVAAIIRGLAQELDPSLPAILAGHLTVSTGIFSGSEKRAIYGTDPLFMPSQLAITPFDYVALGHLHRYQNLNPNGYPAVVYSGSPERVDFGERKEEKGFCDVIIHSKEKTTHTFVKTPQRPFIQIEVTLDNNKSHTDQILDELKHHHIEDAIIKIVYHVPAGVKDRVDVQAIQQACAPAMFLVGIFPHKQIEQRERRAQVHVDMDLTTLLSTYFLSKKEYADHKDRLVKKALEIELFLQETNQE